MVEPDLSYLLEVLNISHGETEDQLDEKLRTEAKELGVEIEHQTHDADIKQSFRPFAADYPRRSDSFDSRASHSTGLASTFSDMSKDHGHCDGQQRRSRASLSFRDYDAFLSRGVPNGRHSISFSPFTSPSHSTFSLPLSQPPSPNSSPRRHFRRIRGLSKLKLGRSESLNPVADGCPHCPPDQNSQRRAIHKLPCGHRLCIQALRNTVKVATETRTGSVPSCCGKPISGSLVEHVMTQEEQNALLDKLELWDEAMSIAPSISSSHCESGAHLRPRALSPRSRAASEESQTERLSQESRKELEKFADRDDYKSLLTEQVEQRDRFLAWAEKQRVSLKMKHETLRDDRRARHETTAEDLQERHASAVAEAEDKQVKAEADMREAHEQERKDNATALKHMEAYCAGTYNNGEAHNRTVTEQDLIELEKARRHRDQMDIRQESAINVLRGEQGRRMRLRSQRQERELQELKRQQRKEELELERACTSEVASLTEMISEKRRKIRWRWELQAAILAKMVESETGHHLDFKLPTAEWHPRHESSTTQIRPIFAVSNDKPERHSPGIIHMREFKIGG